MRLFKQRGRAVMEWLNYHHLQCFWAVVRCEGLSGASEFLDLTPQTISAQVGKLEKAAGVQLFDRSGRRLVLTERGREVYRMAADIFALGQKIEDFAAGRGGQDDQRLVVGIANALPKFVVYHLIEPALAEDPPIRVICREDKAARLLAELALHEFDVIFTDVPIPSDVSIRAFNHLLGSCPVSFMAVEELAERYKKDFPRSLDGAPFLLPTDDTALRKELDRWFHRNRIQPRVVSEHEDSALLKAFGESGAGIFPIASVVEADIRSHYHSQLVGTPEGLHERFYAITLEKRVHNPVVQLLCQQAREVFFAAHRSGTEA